MKQVNTLTLTISFLLTLAGTGFGQSAWAEGAEAAESDESAYLMSVVLDRAEGRTIARGNYQRAILRATTHSNRQPVATNTNLCVAHTMVGQYRHAQHYCDEAVAAAQKADEVGLRKDRDYTMEWAMTLSNRGVLRAMTGDKAGAEEDFRLAIELRSSTELPVQNLAHLQGDALETIAVR